MTLNYDDIVDEISDERMVSWFLTTSFLYYHHNISVISDAVFDRLCVRLLEGLDAIEHQHKHLIDKEALQAGTGFHISFNEFPLRIQGAAMSLLDTETHLYLHQKMEEFLLTKT